MQFASSPAFEPICRCPCERHTGIEDCIEYCQIYSVQDIKTTIQINKSLILRVNHIAPFLNKKKYQLFRAPIISTILTSVLRQCVYLWTFFISFRSVCSSFSRHSNYCFVPSLDSKFGCDDCKQYSFVRNTNFTTAKPNESFFVYSG